MMRERRPQKRLARFLQVAPLALAGGLAVSPARAGSERILAVAESALYGGATGLLLGGVLTLVVKPDNRDDVVRWGVVAGTFLGFGYGLYDARGAKEGFSELVRARADARRLSGQVARSEAGIAPGSTTAMPGRRLADRRLMSCRQTSRSPQRQVEERPDPGMARVTGRNPW
jgi:hypothetical protein